MSEATGVGSMLRTVPGPVDQLLHDFETGNIMVRAVTPELDELPRRLHALGGRLTLAAFASATTIAAAIAVPETTESKLRMVTAAVLALAAVWLDRVARLAPVRARQAVEAEAAAAFLPALSGAPRALARDASAAHCREVQGRRGGLEPSVPRATASNEPSTKQVAQHRVALREGPRSSSPSAASRSAQSRRGPAP